MRKILLLPLLVASCCASALGQKYYVTVDGKSFPDKKGAMTVTRADMAEKAKLTVVPDIGKVIGYSMSYLPVRGEYGGPWSNKQAEMTKQEKFVVGQSRYGDKFFFEDITIKLNSTGEIIHSNSFIVEIQ
ncbi:MAG: hypothetical protein JSS82_14770 [Bacteroidetes bacterium]|nr:hypothetical protein [Bacteroidota bacterium]